MIVARYTPGRPGRDYTVHRWADRYELRAGNGKVVAGWPAGRDEATVIDHAARLCDQREHDRLRGASCSAR